MPQKPEPIPTMSVAKTRADKELEEGGGAVWIEAIIIVHCDVFNPWNSGRKLKIITSSHHNMMQSIFFFRKVATKEQINTGLHH